MAAALALAELRQVRAALPGKPHGVPIRGPIAIRGRPISPFDEPALFAKGASRRTFSTTIAPPRGRYAPDCADVPRPAPGLRVLVFLRLSRGPARAKATQARARPLASNRASLPEGRNISCGSALGGRALEVQEPVYSGRVCAHGEGAPP